MTWGNWIATQGEAFKRGHRGAGTLDAVKGAYEDGFKAGSSDMTRQYGGGGGSSSGGGSRAEEREQSWKMWVLRDSRKRMVVVAEEFTMGL